MSYEQRKLMGLTNSYPSLEEARNHFLPEAEPAPEPRKGIAPTPLKVKPLKIPKIRKRIDPGNTISFKSLLHKEARQQLEAQVRRLREMLMVHGSGFSKDRAGKPANRAGSRVASYKKWIKGKASNPVKESRLVESSHTSSRDLAKLAGDAVKAGRVKVHGNDVHLDGRPVRAPRVAKALYRASSVSK